MWKAAPYFFPMQQEKERYRLEITFDLETDEA